jgi:hypothetical protein
MYSIAIEGIPERWGRDEAIFPACLPTSRVRVSNSKKLGSRLLIRMPEGEGEVRRMKSTVGYSKSVETLDKLISREKVACFVSCLVISGHPIVSCHGTLSFVPGMEQAPITMSCVRASVKRGRRGEVRRTVLYPKKKKVG